MMSIKLICYVMNSLSYVKTLSFDAWKTLYGASNHTAVALILKVFTPAPK